VPATAVPSAVAKITVVDVALAGFSVTVKAADDPLTTASVTENCCGSLW
jgi:hypothetical protein